MVNRATVPELSLLDMVFVCKVERGAYKAPSLLNSNGNGNPIDFNVLAYRVAKKAATHFPMN